MTQQETRRWIARNKVLLGLHEGQWPDGPYTTASNRDLTRETGFGAASVKRALSELEAAGAIRIFPPYSLDTTWHERRIVILSEPCAADYLEFIKTNPVGVFYTRDWRDYEADWIEIDALLEAIRDGRIRKPDRKNHRAGEASTRLAGPT